MKDIINIFNKYFDRKKEKIVDCVKKNKNKSIYLIFSIFIFSLL